MWERDGLEELMPSRLTMATSSTKKMERLLRNELYVGLVTSQATRARLELGTKKARLGLSS